jgi:C1q domain
VVILSFLHSSGPRQLPAIFDTGSNFDTSNSKFTAPVAGFYYFDAVVQYHITSSGVEFDLIMYKNGNQIRNTNTLFSVGIGNYNNTIQCLLQLQANDYIELYASCGAAVTINSGQTITVFDGFLVSIT